MVKNMKVTHLSLTFSSLVFFLENGVLQHRGPEMTSQPFGTRVLKYYTVNIIQILYRHMIFKSIYVCEYYLQRVFISSLFTFFFFCIILFLSSYFLLQ